MYIFTHFLKADMHKVKLKNCNILILAWEFKEWVVLVGWIKTTICLHILQEIAPILLQ